MSLAGLDPLTFGLRTNTAVTFFPLKDWGERKSKELTAQGVVGAIFDVGSGIKDGMVIGINPPAISGISLTGGFEASFSRAPAATTRRSKGRLNSSCRRRASARS